MFNLRSPHLTMRLTEFAEQPDLQAFYDAFKGVYLSNKLNVTYSEPYRDSGLNEWSNGLDWLCATAGVEVC